MSGHSWVSVSRLLPKDLQTFSSLASFSAQTLQKAVTCECWGQTLGQHRAAGTLLSPPS